MFLSIVVGSVQAFAQGYFPNRSDMTLEYVRTNVSDGSFRWRHTVTVCAVQDQGLHSKYTTESVFTRHNGKPLYRSSVFETTCIDKNSGDLSMDVGSAMASYIKARTGLKAESSCVLSLLPASVAPGDTLAPVMAQAKVGPLVYRVIVTERKVLRRETISVPAGTFDCCVLEEHKVESGPGHNRDVMNMTWYAIGVGFVRHDTYIKGKLDTSEVLTSIK